MLPAASNGLLVRESHQARMHSIARLNSLRRACCFSFALQNKDYEFGDGTKALSSATQDAAEAAAAAVIDAGGSAIDAGAAAKKVLDDSGCTSIVVRGGTLASSCPPADRSCVDAASSVRSRPLYGPLGAFAVFADQFGDLTKGAIKGWEEIVRAQTGNEDYKFGDVTKNAMKGLFGMMEQGAAAAKKKLEDSDK